MAPRTLAVAVSAIAAIALAQTAGDTFALKRVAQVGESATYKTTYTIRTDEGAFSIEIKSLETVVEVQANGTLKIDVSQREVKTTRPDGTSQLAPNANYSRLLSATGELVDILGANPDPDRQRAVNLDTLRVPPKPLKLGGKWKHEIKADSKSGRIGVKFEYEILSVERIGETNAVKVRFSAIEGEGATPPATAVGLVWLDVRDFSQIKREVEYKAAPLPPFPIPLDYRMLVERTG